MFFCNAFSISIIFYLTIRNQVTLKFGSPTFNTGFSVNLQRFIHIIKVRYCPGIMS